MNRATLGLSLLALVGAAAAVSGCGDNVSTGATPTPTASGSPTATATATPPSNATPDSGVWHYGEYAPSTNDCHDPDLVTNGNGDFALLDHGDGTVTITPGDGTAPFGCTVASGAISCPNRAAGSFAITGVDATLDAQVSADGTLSDSQHFTGQQHGTVTCTGSQCAAAAASLGTTFPCAYTVDYAVNWVSP